MQFAADTHTIYMQDMRVCVILQSSETACAAATSEFNIDDINS